MTSTYWDECFEHLECLGRGSFAEVRYLCKKTLELKSYLKVYKVRHKEDNQLYAIKRSLTKFRGKSDRDQKLKEVRFHETLATHRNILKIIHAWEERERLYIQTELCQTKFVN
jgi:membrane-associated tyrosine/threonine-specific cdc2-inhibitory kinase